MKLLFILLCATLIAENPNGRLWTLTVGYNTYNKSIEAKLPIFKFLTVSFNQLQNSRTYNLQTSSSTNGYLLNSRDIDTNIDFSNSEMTQMCDSSDEWWENNCIYGFYDDYSQDSDISIDSGDVQWVSIPTYRLNANNNLINNYKIELHLPIYRLWEK